MIGTDWIDYNGHVNDSRYLQLSSLGVDTFMGAIGIDADYLATGRTYMTVESHVGYVDQCHAGDHIYVDVQLLAHDPEATPRLHVDAPPRQWCARGDGGAPAAPRRHEGIEDRGGGATDPGSVGIDRTGPRPAPLPEGGGPAHRRPPGTSRRSWCRDMSTIEVERDGPVAVIRLNRREVHNALDPPMLTALLAAVVAAAADDEVRAIVLTGGPTAFTTGEDLVTATTLDNEAFRHQIGQFQELATALRFAPKPVVAAIAGPAYGGGLEIAVNCDVRIAADNARFACPEVEWSLTLSNGSSVLLRRVVGEGWARELLLFGTVLDADTALRIGLVTRVVPIVDLEPQALAMAHRAAEYAPGGGGVDQGTAERRSASVGRHPAG